MNQFGRVSLLLGAQGHCLRLSGKGCDLGFHGLLNAFEPLGTTRVWTNLSPNSRQHVLEITVVYLNSTHLLMRFSRDVQELGATCLERLLKRVPQVGTARVDFEPAGACRRLAPTDDTVAEEPPTSLSRRTGRCAAGCSPRQQCGRS